MFEAPERFNVGTLVDRNLEAGRGDKVALRCEGAELTYAQLHDRVCRAGNALRALGVRREQRVLMILDDTPAFPAVFLGAIRIGAVPAPVSFLDIAGELPPLPRSTLTRRWSWPRPPCWSATATCSPTCRTRRSW